MRGRLIPAPSPAPAAAPDYARLAWYPILVMGFTSGGLICIRTGRDAAFFSPKGLETLPAACLIAQVGLTLAAVVHVRAMARWGSRRVRESMFLLLPAILAGFVPFIDREHPGAMAVLFPLVPVLFAALFSSGWLLAGDLLDGAEPDLVRRTYARTGASGLLGGVLGGLLASGLATFVPPRGIVLVGLVLVAAMALVARDAHRRGRPVAVQPSAGTKTDAAPGASLFALLTGTRYTRLLAAIGALSAISTMLVELQFYAAAASTGNTSPGFFAVWYVISGTAGLILQLTLASRLASRFGLTGALLLLPAATLAGGAAVAGVALMIVPALFRVSESAVRASVHQSSWEQVFLRYEREVRARIKVAVDGVVSRIAAGFIALALTVAVWLRGPDVLASALGLGLGLTLVSILWLVMTARLRREGVAAPPPGLFVAAPPPDS